KGRRRGPGHVPNGGLSCGRPRRKCPATPGTQQAGHQIQANVMQLRNRRSSFVVEGGCPANTSVCTVARQLSAPVGHPKVPRENPALTVVNAAEAPVVEGISHHL